MTSWKDKISVITGAGSGIGSGLARYCAKRGMIVIAADVDEVGLDKLKSEISGKGQTIVTAKVDVTDHKAVESFSAMIFEEYGQVNLLFNNAGVLIDGKSWERSYQDWRWIIDVNIMGVVNGIRSFVPKMLTQDSDGKIINTSSQGGLLGGGNYMASYQATKHAVVAITESLHAELLLEGSSITAGCLCPGDTATAIWESDRLRPESEKYQLGSDAEIEQHELIVGMIAKGLSVDELADKTFNAIEAGKFWIFPQPDFKPMLQLRLDAIVNETLPPSTQEIMDMMNA